MDKQAFWKWLILVALVCVSIALIVPPKEKIRLGLDLKGGVSFVCTVDRQKIEDDVARRSKGATAEELEKEVDDALDGAQQRALEVLRTRLNGLGIAEPSIVGKADRIEIQLPGIDEAKRDDAKASIEDIGFLEFRLVHPRNDVLVDRLLDGGQAPEGYRITTVNGQAYYRMRTPDADAAARSFEETRELLGSFGVPGPEYEFMLMADVVENTPVLRPFFVLRDGELESRHLKNARPETDNYGGPAVGLTFTAKGAKVFASVTAANIDRQLAIVVDGSLYSAPNIQVAIPDGRAQITGSFNSVEAQRLVNVLRSGALPTKVKIVEEHFVAPSLGEDSINRGVKAIVLGGTCVLLFMLVYYMACGVVANLALVLNIVLLPVGMVLVAGLLGAGGGTVKSGAIQLPTLTLPGIAGILLTIGMAVDANVLIFERIREEQKSGKRLWNAIQAGYDRAFITILDANVTTLMTGVILFVFGSGPIRGFAVTLCGGIIISMYTALVVTKMFFALFAEKGHIKSLRMLSVVKDDINIDFVGKRKFAGVLSLSVIVICAVVMIARGIKNPSSVLGYDFTGGTSITLSFTSGEQASTGEVEATLLAAGIENPVIQYERNLDSAVDTRLQIKTGFAKIGDQAPREIIKTALPAAYPAANYEAIAEDEIGPQIGAELKKSAFISIIIALAGIILYISWRFEFGFALGAIVALAHDVLVTLGLFTLLGNQISLPIVAALLTIVGYSVNDTIVVFDRIREDLRLEKKRTFKEICNLSINQTLSRTILTSFTTLITVVMLLIFGGGAIFDFALALFIGVLVGTYSSIFVATPIVLLWHRDKKPELSAVASKTA
jgi:SecD/SecF fusion protein